MDDMELDFVFQRKAEGTIYEKDSNLLLMAASKWSSCRRGETGVRRKINKLVSS